MVRPAPGPVLSFYSEPVCRANGHSGMRSSLIDDEQQKARSIERAKVTVK